MNKGRCQQSGKNEKAIEPPALCVRTTNDRRVKDRTADTENEAQQPGGSRGPQADSYGKIGFARRSADRTRRTHGKDQPTANRMTIGRGYPPRKDMGSAFQPGWQCNRNGIALVADIMKHFGAAVGMGQTCHQRAHGFRKPQVQPVRGIGKDRTVGGIGRDQIRMRESGRGCRNRHKDGDAQHRRPFHQVLHDQGRTLTTGAGCFRSSAETPAAGSSIQRSVSAPHSCTTGTTIWL